MLKSTKYNFSIVNISLQRAGVPLSSKDTRYTTDNFAKLLRSVVGPEIGKASTEFLQITEEYYYNNFFQIKS